jgi:dipeptidyl-peptidase-4
MGNHVAARRAWLPVLLLLVVGDAAIAQQKRLTLADIYDPQMRISFSGSVAAMPVWIDGGHYASARPAAGGVEWLRVDAVAGSIQPLFDASRMEAALSRLPGVSAEDARRASRSRGLTFDDRFRAAMIAVGDDLFVYRFDQDRAVRLTSAAGREETPSFSPNGALVAFVRSGNLYVSDVETGRETALTTDGTDDILNGKLDWVYEEEIFGRGASRAYWWSPDSSKLAYLRLDDTGVPITTIVNHLPEGEVVERQRYPKAGDPNPGVALGVVNATGGATVWMDLARYPERDRLVVSVSWLPDSRRVFYSMQNRIQTWLDLNVGDAGTGAGRTIIHETSKAWIGLEDRCTDPSCGTADPIWLEDGSFVRLSSRTGWPHAYLFAADGTVRRQITSGNWELRALLGVDQTGGWVYFLGTERSPIDVDVYRVKLDGSSMQRLSPRPGTHDARFSRDFSLFLDSWSDITTPPQLHLHRSDGTAVRVISENKVAALSEYRLSPPEFLQVKTRDGFVMEAMMIKPPDFNPSRRYPVFQFTYGGPHYPTVRNTWGGSQYIYHQLLAQQGIIIWVCDNRTSSGKGIESTWPLYRNFGELELRDIEDGIAWLKQQPYVDGSRIGLYGWSFGGFITTYALTHSTSFAMGIAGGTVADWRLYDSVYTERYMGLPKDNEEGYRKSAPLHAAGNLHGALFLLHGMIDDNVHVENTLQLAYELQKAHKTFRMMLYPNSRHGVVDPSLVYQMRTLMFEFTLEHLKPAPSQEATAAARD